ncbi:MAG: hypothetical protein OHK0024_03080 [Thalassobaculales bacterium]
MVQTQSQLAEANQKLDEANANLEAANAQIKTLENDNQTLKSALEVAEAQNQLLQVLAQVNEARLALTNGDVPAAKAALKDTPTQLETVAAMIAPSNEALANSMTARLALILSGLDNNVDNAIVDLELLAGNLLDAQKILTGK